MTQVLSAMSRKASCVNSDKLRLILQSFMISQFNYRRLIWMYHDRNKNWGKNIHESMKVL